MMVPYALIRRVCVRLSVAASSIFSAGLRRRLSGGVGVGVGVGLGVGRILLLILLLPPLFHFLGRPLSPSALGGRRGGRFIHRMFRGVIHGLRRLAPGVALNGRGGGRLRRCAGGGSATLLSCAVSLSAPPSSCDCAHCFCHLPPPPLPAHCFHHSSPASSTVPSMLVPVYFRNTSSRLGRDSDSVRSCTFISFASAVILGTLSAPFST